MPQCKLRIIVLSAVVVFFGQPAILLAWPDDPTVNVPICTAPGNQSHQVMLNDGKGGAIIAWEDERTADHSYDIYAQRVNANGEVQWTENGILLCPELGGQRGLRIVSDGAGGAIIVWEDFRSDSGPDIRAQRVDSSGILQWAEDGIVICTASNSQVAPSLVNDGEGGAIIVWQDARNSTGIYSAEDIYAQRVNANGEIQWTENGVSICTASNSQVAASVVADGRGGAIIAWRDYRSANHIYMQWVNADGDAPVDREWSVHFHGFRRGPATYSE